MFIFVAFDGRPPTDDHALQSVALRKLCHAKIAKTHMGLREAFLCRVVEKARAELVLLAGVPQIMQLMAQGQARACLPIEPDCGDDVRKSCQQSACFKKTRSGPVRGRKR